MTSFLQHSPKSKIIEHGYINIYSKLNPQEMRQISYKRAYKSKNPNWDETQVFLAKKFADLTPHNSKIFDAGCGNGNYIIDENRASISWAAGLDVSKDFVQKNICLDEIIIGNLEKLPFEDNSFDAVTSLWVLEHLKNPEAVFAEIYRILRPSGIFMFATPNRNFLPLIIIRILKFTRINHLLNSILFGRKKIYIFETYYRANILSDIRRLNKNLFEIVELKLNYDPSYLSFNSISFRISSLAHKIFNNLGISIFEPHIIGILRKP